MGFAWVSIGHHWLSHPTVWPHPIAMLSRLAPEAGEMRLKTSMLLLPLLNPVDVAESVVTLDHITHGRLDVGVAIGYRELEREARAAESTAGTAFASRSLIVGASKEVARAAARGYLERTFAMYRSWQMQEPGMVQLQLGFDANLDDWTINGTPAQCLETIARGRALGLDGIGLTIYSLPREVKARIEYLRMIAEQIVRPVAALGR